MTAEIHVFNKSAAKSKSYVDAPWWPIVYRMAFPNMQSAEPIKEDGWAQRAGMDVASPGADVVPWIPASAHITKLGPARRWSGFCWMNPPFGARNGIAPWLARFFGEDIVGGVCLTPDRTSAPWWQLYAPRAGRILFVSPKIRFIDASGAEGKSPAQGTTLMSRGERGNRALENAARNRLGMLCVPQATIPMVLAA